MDRPASKYPSWVMLALPVLLTGCISASPSLPPYAVNAGGITAPLTNAAPDAVRGKAVLVSRDSNCILCHAVPETGERFFGNLGPSLSGVGVRLNAAQMRLRIVDPQYFNPDSIMPAYYKVDGLTRVAENLRGKPVLTAAQIEDVIAYLQTLH